jgi:hypothetical protein
MSKLNRRQFISGAVAATGACVINGVAVERVLDAEDCFKFQVAVGRHGPRNSCFAKPALSGIANRRP